MAGTHHPHYAARAAHPFYCHKKRCRKTAWAAPECLSHADWQLARQFQAILDTQDHDAMTALMFSASDTDALFNRILGWPEGRQYCRSMLYRQDSFPSWQRHYSAKLATAIAAHAPYEETASC